MGCAGNQCCFSEVDEISICEHILGDGFFDEITEDQNLCFVRQFNENQPCVGAGHGCWFTFDNSGNVEGSADFMNGSGYLRPRLGGSQFRDAKNQIADLRVWRAQRSNVGTFVDRRELQAPSCVHNTQDHACWGEEQGHPCVCFHYPPVNCPVGDPPSPDNVIIKNLAVYIHDGWPFNPGFQTGNRGFFHPHRWDENPAIDLSLIDSRRGQTKFVSGMRDWKNVGTNFATNALVQCQAFVPNDSPCLDCSGIRTCDDSGCEANQEHYFGGSGHPNTNLFKQLLFQQWNPTLQGSTPEVELYNEVLDFIQGHEFPVSGGFPGQVTLFDRLDDHMGDPNLASNIGLGTYSRGWTATVTEQTPQGPVEVADISAGVKVKDLEDVRTKWGGCPINADLVIVDVQVWAHAHLHKSTSKHTRNKRDVWPFFVLSITVKVGIRATLADPEPCAIGEEPVEIFYRPGSMFPSVTPLGNEVDYGQRVQPVIEWRGRLSNLSEPSVHGREYMDARPPPQESTGGAGCEFVRVALDIDPIDIPPLPGDAEGDDPNNWFGGNIRLRFHKP